MARPRIQGITSTGRRATAIVALVALVATGTALACRPKPRSVESFCTQLKGVEDLDEVLAGADRSQAGDRAAKLQELQHVAPDEVEPHVARLAAVTDDLARTMGTAPDPDAAVIEVFARRKPELADITAAGRAVEAYSSDHCKVVLNPATTPPPGANTASTAPPPTTRSAPKSTRRPTTKASGRSTTRQTTATTRRSSTTRKATTTTRRR